jgi:arylsulfatase A-like enzyme
MLLSGTDNHVAGLGNMYESLAENQRGKPGYEGYLNFSVVALPELLLDAGYHTYMTGKWHLGLSSDNSPQARGFENSFSLLPGGAGHFDSLPLEGPGDAPYREDKEIIQELPKDFYSTKYFTDTLVKYIEANRRDENPFFAYLAFSAPHWPLQAPAESIRKQKGRYDEGYDVIYQRRQDKLHELGLISKDTSDQLRLPGELAWSMLTAENKKIEAKKMEIYAAMVSDIDSELLKLFNYLKSINEYENTVIIFMSDNGAEGHDLPATWEGLNRWVEACCNNNYENMGKADSYLWYGPNWARVSSGPFRMFKGYTSEGGMRVPAIIRYPTAIQAGTQNRSVISVMDVMPTLLNIAGIEHPAPTYKQRRVEPMQGSIILPLPKERKRSPSSSDRILGWELFGKKALRRGDWKIVLEPGPRGNDKWQMYHLASDPGEQNDLAQSDAKKLNQLIALWEDYAKENNIIIPSETSGY